MTTWLKKSATELSKALQAGEVTAVELVEESLARIDRLDPVLNAFITVDREGALETAREVDQIRNEGGELHPLAGIPIAIKDNIVTRGLETTCASRILEGWEPPYDATVVERIKAARLPIMGKTNLDEFAMGSSTEFSAYGPSRNPWDTDRTPGGSGGGSATAVAAYMVPLALGSDTGGSIRQPSSFTGTVGVKPTYGRVSRFGGVALASSLDQIGPVARNVLDAATLFDLLAGHDPKDATSLPGSESALAQMLEADSALKDAKGLRVGIIEQLSGDGYQNEVLEAFERTVSELRDAGAEIINVSCPSFDLAFSAYYLIMPAEASSNLARFDGVRFGKRFYPEGVETPTANEMMATTRDQGLGFEVKRRIILGTHVLSAGYYDAYYGAALKVRTLIQRELEEVFKQVDVVISPTTTTTAFALGERVEDPLAMYLNDVATIPANLAGLPAMAVPNGVDSDGMPTSAQVFAGVRDDETMFKVAALIEKISAEHVPDFPENGGVVGVEESVAMNKEMGSAKQ